MKKPYLLAAAILTAALLLSSCIVIPAVQQSAPPAQSAAPTDPPAKTTVPAETATAAPPTPAPVLIDFAPIDPPAARQLAQVALGKPLQDALAILGQPKDIFGKGTYQYKAVAGGADAVPASVYRFEIDHIPLELIVRDSDDLVLRKQISTPEVMPKLVADASAVQIADGSAYADALAALGTNPYLWTEFLLPGDAADAHPYQVAVWPDANGQFAAVIKDGIVLRSEYQTLSLVPEAAVADGVTPRVPRFLRPLPGVVNAQVAHHPLYLKFAKLQMNAPEADVLAAFGPPTREDTSAPVLRVLTYEVASADFSGEKAIFTFTLTTGETKVLVAKKAALLPKANTDLRARYAPQILGGMKLSSLGKAMFRHNNLATNQYIDPDGHIISSYSWMANRAMINALVPQGSDTVIGSDFALYDTAAEAATLYEEYVLPPIESAPAATPKPRPTPTPHISFKPSFSLIPSLDLPSLRPSLSFKPLPTPTPSPTLRLKSLIPRISLLLPTPTPVLIY